MKTVFIVFPLKMSLIAKQRVVMARLVRELAHRPEPCRQHESAKRKDISRGVF